jgi:RimJ/RimL family protein N-acetyltransferase
LTQLAPLLGSGAVVLDAFPETAVSETYIGWLNDAAVMSATEAGRRQHTIESARDYVTQQNASDDVLFWRIFFKGRHVGNLRASGLSGPHRRAAVALLIGERSVHGRGVGSTAIRLATEHLFGLGLHKVTAGMYASNVASQRAFLKAGFATEAILRDQFIHEGQIVDGILVACFAQSRGLLLANA